MVKVIGFCASCQKSGKTTLLLKLLESLHRRGTKTAVIKHAHHLDVDEDKDSTRFAAAGASCAMVVSPQGWVLEAKPSEELPLDKAIAIISSLSGCDVLLIEGYKDGDIPKIAVCRSDVSLKLPCAENDLLAVVSDTPVDTGLPRFDLNHDVEAICDFIMTLEDI